MISKDKLADIVGSENVDCDQATLEAYSSDFSFVNKVRPACVVKPTDSGQIQKIIKLANESQTALVPISSGAPHFRGDTIPGIGGAVIIDMSQMKKIVFVDRPRRVAMVEPGVTFGELIPAAEKEGLRLNMPLLPRATKSVVGSILEREPVMMPKYQWDISDPIACAEVFFGNGEEFRTGQSAGPGTVEEQWKVGGLQKAPYGPGIGSWHRLLQGAQGTMGIVSWISLRCEIKPSVEEPFVLGSADLDPLLDLTAWLVRLRIANECFILNNTNLATIFAKDYAADYEKLKKQLPTWTLFYTIAGYDVFPEERVEAYKKEIDEVTQRLNLDPAKSVGPLSANAVLRAVKQPSEELYWKLKAKGACQDIPYLTINEKLSLQVGIMNGEAERYGYDASNIGVYIQPSVQGTNYHCEFNLYYDAESAQEASLVKDLSARATKRLMGHEAFFSRPYGENAGMIVNKDAATVAIFQKMKKIFDPNNIMNPGKICF